MSTQGDDQSWVARALCASIEPDVLFVQGASQRQVRMRCYECEVRLECLADALESAAPMSRRCCPSCAPSWRAGRIEP